MKKKEIQTFEKTPGQIARDFFSNNETQELFIQFLVSRGFNEIVAKSEINKFIAYWSEPNKSGTKQKWELERTFEIRRRLATWLNNAAKWGRENNNKYKVGSV